jgi:hypothetical protein
MSISLLVRPNMWIPADTEDIDSIMQSGDGEDYIIVMRDGIKQWEKYVREWNGNDNIEKKKKIVKFKTANKINI